MMMIVSFVSIKRLILELFNTMFEIRLMYFYSMLDLFEEDSNKLFSCSIQLRVKFKMLIILK